MSSSSRHTTLGILFTNRVQSKPYLAAKDPVFLHSSITSIKLRLYAVVSRKVFWTLTSGSSPCGSPPSHRRLQQTERNCFSSRKRWSSLNLLYLKNLISLGDVHVTLIDRLPREKFVTTRQLGNNIMKNHVTTAW